MPGTNGAITVTSGGINGRDDSNVYGVSWEATADASAATFAEQTIPKDNIGGGFLPSISAKFDDTTPPDALTVTVSDRLGIVKATSTFTASGTDALSPAVQFVGPLTVALSDNTTNGAKAIVDIGVI